MISNLRNPYSRTAFKSLLGGLAGLTGYACFYQFNQYVQKTQNWKNIQDGINQFNPITLENQELVYYPWIKDLQSLKKWEYKVVNMTGYFKEERFFVARKRDGKDGYLVFAPFITATRYNEGNNPQQLNPNVDTGIFVNLGWVPQENKDDIEMGSEPVPLLEADEADSYKAFNRNPYTGFTLDKEPIDEDKVVPLTKITGLVRVGEEEDILNRRRNWDKEGVFNFIDLHYMARFHKFFNITGASRAYIERIVPSYEDDAENLYPVPASINNYDKPILTPQKHLDTSFFWGLTSAASFVSFIVLLKK